MGDRVQEDEETGLPVIKTSRKDGNRESREEASLSARKARAQRNHAVDLKFGYERYVLPRERIGWLINIHPADVMDESKHKLVSAVDFYFIEEDGQRFKATMKFKPYFYVAVKKSTEREVTSYLSRKFSGHVSEIEMVDKEDLDLPNHLVGLRRRYLKLQFASVDDLMKAKREVLHAVRKNKDRDKASSAYDPALFTSNMEGSDLTINTAAKITDQMENILDIREHDVPYHVRVAIDLKLNVGHWYEVKGHGLENPEIRLLEEQPDRPEPVVCAFDIETTKLPLKFPDPATDTIMMISYMVDGQGYLITNREVVGDDISDFEYTPKPEYEGLFTVFNEPDEYQLLRRFLDHMLELKPNIFVTYNGDSFDWPFVQARAEFHELSLEEEIGFAPDNQNEYKCRPCIHMDAFRWVKRDSYLPVGSQNLKATTRAKLRYDPVELDPEDMCRMACEDPQGLSNYSVSDAVATYYLYMKYVHPFIFALCTIIPMEPDEVLRKGSGTLCETLLMVQAFHGNIIFPNKQEAALNKLTSDGHVLDSETYVGGHVEALESGVFRSDIPCRFKMDGDMCQYLSDNVRRTMEHAIEKEEKIPLEYVTNLDDVVSEIQDKFATLKATPHRLECPMIYHLDVGAMYPNIILTNRLQPSAIVDEATCAACDFNKPGATCQRVMEWKWRGDFMPASRNEYQSIRLQLESETFPPDRFGNKPRSFHSLPPYEQAQLEKKRLQEYCRKAYKRVRMTREEGRTSTICQRENSFYVDTVRAFRDRRYQFKGLLKVWKKKLEAARQSGDPAEIKSCKNKEVLYDSLQLAHKCILNSFYGYVMRKGARWYSMEMAGVVCYTGANIITKARQIVDLIGRPLELDTDGIWCILPSSFPENFEILTTHPKKSRVTISYPGAMLNVMVQDYFTNDQYQELVDPDKLTYEQRSENSIFFEVDGPYRAMILPASKEEGKKLKKRYAVFNEDGSLAELKGFEVKRRGELGLVKNFQSSVFEVFLQGSTLEECYAAVASIADYWLDVLYSKAENMPDSELFDLISENRSMSRKLEDYGEQKSTSISTAKRLAEFLGDQMVKDAGLACRFIISRKPEGAPVTERAIPLAIFQAESSVKKHFLRKWLKSSGLENFDIRAILDWNYYIERLGNTIQKIITIPAAMQGVANPVPRVAHPDWLRKKMLEKNDVCKQQRITEIFKRTTPKTNENLMDVSLDHSGSNRKRSHGEVSEDIEDLAQPERAPSPSNARPVVTRHVTTPSQQLNGVNGNWRTVLGPPPDRGATREEFLVWLKYHKEKWKMQKKKRDERKRLLALEEGEGLGRDRSFSGVRGVGLGSGLSSMLRQQTRALIELAWEVIQIVPQSPGVFTLWVLVGGAMHRLNLHVPRVFYVNAHSSKELQGEGSVWRQVSKALPRSTPVLHLSEYSVAERIFQEHASELTTQLSAPDIEGVYETQVPLLFKAVTSLGCVCAINKKYRRSVMSGDSQSYELDQLELKSVSDWPYLQGEEAFKKIFIFHSTKDARGMFGVFVLPTHKASVFVLDRVRTNQLPNLRSLYQTERTSRMARYQGYPVTPGEFIFDARVDTEARRVHRGIHRLLVEYKEGRRGPTVIFLQSPAHAHTLTSAIPALKDFPVVHLAAVDSDSQYPALNWQRMAAKKMLQEFLNLPAWIQNRVEQARYAHIPLGNLPADPYPYIADVFYARYLTRHNHVLWASPMDQPDLGGREDDDHRLMTDTEDGRSMKLNCPGAYPTCCVELSLEGLAVNTVLQSHHINDFEGAAGTSTAFDWAPQASLEELIGGTGSALSVYDEAALCSGSFKVMRQVVHSWLMDVKTHSNLHADYQLQHFYRWIHSPSSLLYEPALCRMIHKLMKKLFMQLVGEFKRLGSTIVYADFSKIVVCTQKKNMSDASSYISFILRSIKSRELFYTLNLEPVSCWEYLLWMDQANYGGISVALPKSLRGMGEDEDEEEITEEEEEEGEEREGVSGAEEEEDQPESGSMETESQRNGVLDETWGDISFSSVMKGGEGRGQKTDKRELQMNWHICKYLPEEGSCSSCFQVIIAGHIQALYDHATQERLGHTPGSTPVRRRVATSQTQQCSDSALAASLVTFAQERIEKELSEKLFSIVQNLHQTLGRGRGGHGQHLVGGADEEDTGLFPLLPGSHLSLTNPALELVKTVCQVLLLDSSTRHQVNKLRRDLLKLIGVREFSLEAIFQDPCKSFILPEVICEVCNNCRDLDLCRDTFCCYHEPSQRLRWLCSQCKNPYNMDVIEQSLVDAVNRRSLAYIVQDLVCCKCHGVKEGNMAEFCSCMGNFTVTLSRDAFMEQLITFRNIAKYYSLNVLFELVDSLLSMNNMK